MKNIDSKAVIFIKEVLESFIVLFPQTRVRYEYDLEAAIHSIEIVPNEVYHTNDEYIDWENTTTNSFIEKFPDQNICFISDDALVGLDEVHFELIGKNYIKFISVNHYPVISKIHITNSNISYNSMINPSTTEAIMSLDNLFASIKNSNSLESNNRYTTSDLRLELPTSNNENYLKAA